MVHIDDLAMYKTIQMI